MAEVVATPTMCEHVGRTSSSEQSAAYRWLSEHPDLICALYGLLLGVGVCWPLFGGRPLFLLDWVAGPHAALVPASVYGLNGGLTTSILSTLGTATLLHVFGEAATWLVLFAFFPIAALGVGRLVGGSVLARVAAASVVCVNPWVFDRIYAGQLALIFGFALLPFATRAALRDRGGHDVIGALACALWWAILTALSPQFAWIYGVVVVVGAVTLWVRRRRAQVLWRSAGAAAAWFAGAAGASCAMTLYVLVAHSATSLPVKVGTATLEIYATTGDRHLGLFANVAALYGFWRRGPGPTLPKDVITGWPFLMLAILAVVATGYWVVLRTRHGTHDGPGNRQLGWPLLAIGIVGYFFALGAQGPTGGLFRWAYRVVPFFDVMREPQKVLMLTVLMYAVGIGWGIGHLQRTSPGSARPWVRFGVAAAVGIALPLGYTATMFDGLGGQIAPSVIPAAYAQANRLMGKGSGQVLFFPWHLYEALPFAGDRVVANLGPSVFERPVISGDNVQVGRLETQSTSPRSRYLGQFVDGERSRRAFGAQVAPLGVEYVVLAKVVDWRTYAWLAHEPDLRLVSDTPSLEIWRNLAFDGVGHRPGASRPVVEISPVAYRVPGGRRSMATIDAPYERGWTLEGVAGVPTPEGDVGFPLDTVRGGTAVFSPWGPTKDGYVASGAAAFLVAAVLTVDRWRRRRRGAR